MSPPDDQLSDWANRSVAPGSVEPAGRDAAAGATDDADVAGDAGVTGDEAAANDGGATANGAAADEAGPVTGQQPLIDFDLGDDPRGATTGAAAGATAGAAASGAGAPVSRHKRHQEWRRTEKARRVAARKSVRFPIFTRAVLLWMLIFALVGVAFGASGAFWWANFNSQVSDLKQDTDDFESRSLEAQNSIESLRAESLQEIDAAIEPLKAFLSESQMLQLAQLFSPSVYTVATLDEAGLPSVGTGFSVINDGADTYFVTSYTTIKAATVAPGPAVTIRKGTEEVTATVWNWDAARDLALIKAPRADVPVLDWVPAADQAGAVGTRVFPVSGLGGAGAALTNGMIIDQSASGFQHDAPLGAAFQGGPIVNVDGKVVGVASLTYAPLGFDAGPQIHFAVPVEDVCQRLISCGGSRSPGAQGG